MKQMCLKAVALCVASFQSPVCALSFQLTLSFETFLPTQEITRYSRVYIAAVTDVESVGSFSVRSNS